MATNKVVSAADVIAKSIDIFGPKGEHWITGVQHDGHGNYCMLGAIKKAGQVLGAPEKTVREARVEVAKATPGWQDTGKSLTALNMDAYSDIPDFNDTKLTYAPIKRVMCKALKSALKAAERR